MLQLCLLCCIISYVSTSTYHFIHPTKTGGTAVEDFFFKYYSHLIEGKYHLQTAHKFEHPIITLREPMDRLRSIYMYWKYGATSGPFQRSTSWRKAHESTTIHDFLKLLSDIPKHNAQLYVGFTNKHHFYEQSYWISPAEYNRTIVLLYCKDMNSKTQQMLYFLNITDSNGSKEKVSITNPSKVSHENMTLSKTDQNLIRNQLFQKDFLLYETIIFHPEKFRRIF